MIITKVAIENFVCYNGVKEFDLSNGLNIILGGNGEGKTSFFEALDWLFNGDNSNLNLWVSAKALADANINEKFLVRVAITVKQIDEIKIITKSFLVNKIDNVEYVTSNYMVEGVEENSAGERSQVDGKELLERIFPVTVRRYSMFKGEAELNIFKNNDALINLINSFSSAKYFSKYSEKGKFLREKAERAVDDATRSDNKNQNDYKRLETEILRLSKTRDSIIAFINSNEEQINKIEENIQEAEKYVSNAEALNTINNRIRLIETKISETSKRINENYTTSLFDENWILVNFEIFHHEFTKKVNELSNKKRALQQEFDRQIGIEQGKKALKAELLNNSIPLPSGVPSKAIMEEMLTDEICKVCNRPAPKGSEAYLFMQKRLAEYLKSQEPEETENEEEKILFKSDYISRLFNLGISHDDNLSKLRGIKHLIKDQFEFNEDRKRDLEELELKLEQEFNDREKIIGVSSVGAEVLGNVLKNYNGWQRDLKSYNKELNDNKIKLKTFDEDLRKKKEEKDLIDVRTANKFLLKTREILRDIEQIFNDTKERKFAEFIEKLQSRSNSIFENLNIESFTGTIVFTKGFSSGKDIIKIELHEADGKLCYLPNQSLVTSMHISILFAISELASELREESYPMIFDAPTSSFDEPKISQFLNLIYENGHQIILLTKDFLAIDEVGKKLAIKKEFSEVRRHKAFWILLERPFNKKDLSTLNTQVITL